MFLTPSNSALHSSKVSIWGSKLSQYRQTMRIDDIHVHILVHFTRLEWYRIQICFKPQDTLREFWRLANHA